MATASHGYKLYWIIWGVLLVVTVGMVFIAETPLPEIAHVLLLLAGSCVKATLIIFFFMHLKFEKAGLILTVLVGIFLTGILMFVLPAYDGMQIFDQVTFPARGGSP